MLRDPGDYDAAEEAAFERIADAHPDWTDGQVWLEVQREQRDQEEAFWESIAEDRKFFDRYGH